MGIGHAAVALGASRAAPRLNVGLLVFAAFLADFLLGIFAAFNLEQAHVPPDFAARHYLTFTFPYSHSLIALVLWAVILGALFSRVDKQHTSRAFWIVAALVLSHFVLDALVHVPELPLLAQNGVKVGLGLWNYMPLELTLETLMALAGIALYWKLWGTTRVTRWGMAAFVLLVTGLTWTQLSMVSPPKPSQLVSSWIIGPLLFSAIPYVLDRKRAASAKISIP